ncbi:MAG TPA: glycosyltransferase family 9 protein [Opitutaceae bacterium]|nr:glycosyltransferase family 9 protein [Opitutaceae bacterium]
MPLLQILGWVLARTPEALLRLAAAAGGELLWRLSGRRRRLILSNLSHAFPDRSRAWRRRLARASCRRLAETALLSLATPYLSERRIRRIARLGPSVEAWARDRAARPRPVVFGTCHLALWESQTWLPLLSPVPLPEFGTIFRPLDHPQADAYIKRTRERFGMRLLSRREGFAQAQRILRENGCVGVLFDQNAGLQGTLTLLLGRVCSTTDLPGLLAAKFGAELRTFYPRRTGFWRVAFESDPIAHDGTAAGATLALNRWLEATLERDEALCAGWLWAHDRWRHQDIPAARLRLASKRNLLAADLAARGLAELPRRLRVRVRLPNWLGDVAMAVPLLRALRKSRPDAELTLVARKHFLPLLAVWQAGDRLEALPPRGPAYFAHFRRRRADYPDLTLLFTQSARGDLEAWLTGSPQRFGIVRPGRRRPLLTAAYLVPGDFDEAAHPQLELWGDFLRHFGLAEAPDCAPPGFDAGPGLPGLPPPADGGPIGLIPGSENTPAKRWPAEHWRTLIAARPDRRFLIFGTARDAAIARAVAEGTDPARVANLAGMTDLPAFAACLQTCRLLVTNDTGGMHLANAVGVPLIALFGPTNPVRTGPVFRAPVRILQPPGCPPQGGRPLADLPPDLVLRAIAEMESSRSLNRLAR